MGALPIRSGKALTSRNKALSTAIRSLLVKVYRNVGRPVPGIPTGHMFWALTAAPQTLIPGYAEPATRQFRDLVQAGVVVIATTANTGSNVHWRPSE